MLKIITIILALALNAAAQLSPVKSLPAHEISVYHNRHIIKSAYVNEERSVLVRVPPGYDKTDARYPVIYMLDGHGQYLSAVPGIIESQSWGGQMPEMILVSIQNTVRTRDLTPTVISRYESGGGEKFLDFIQKEVMPLVEKEYRTEPYKIFAGHSLGGLFVTYAFTARPELFNAYIAASPALYYDNNLVVKRAEELLAQKRDFNKIMYFAVGDEPIYTPSFNALKSVFEKAKPRGVSYEFREFKEDNHGSVTLPAYYAGLRKIFAGWAYPQNPSIAAQEAHFKKLSEKYGFEVKVPEDLVNTIGYEQLGQKKYAEAIAAFKRNTELYPNSANTYDSLASAYEANGDKKKAIELYEKAWKMAEKNGETELAKSARANFERLSAR